MLHHKSILLLATISLGLFIAGCKEERVGPLPASDAVPAKVTDLKVVNTPGGAKIAYVVPADPNLLYVQAEWEYKGIKRNTKSSYYGDTLVLQGFGDTDEYKVSVYSVNRVEKRSEPVDVTVKPLNPPVHEVYASLKVKPDFGGVNVDFVNETRGDVVITVLTKDAEGKMIPVDAFYTGLPKGNFTTRGLEPKPTLFGVFVKDRWGNISDTLLAEETPFFEKELDKKLFRELNPYPGDVNGNIYSAAYPMKNLWDGANSIFVTAQAYGVPVSFSIDLGVKAKLSRMKYFQRQSTAFYFNSGTPLEWDVYGSNSPAPDGNYDSWKLLMHCTSHKPSGLPLGQASADDISYALAGEDFNFPLEAEGYRYLRFNVTKTYGNATNITFAELTFWGAF